MTLLVEFCIGEKLRDLGTEVMLVHYPGQSKEIIMIFRIVFLAQMFRVIKVYGKILQDLNQQYSSLKFLRPLNIQDDN